MKKEAWIVKHDLPYLYEQYNVSCFTTVPQSLTRNMLARLVNCFIKALNDTTKLPQLVLIAVDWDILLLSAKEQYLAELKS